MRNDTGTDIGTWSNDITTTGTSITTSTWNVTQTKIIADGDNIIIYGLDGDNYIMIKNTSLVNFKFNANVHNVCDGELKFNFSGVETKNFKIPDYIPEEQHVKFIKGKFKVE